MQELESPPLTGRFARDEAGTAPGDRAFRPDVEGLRAVAVLLVVLFHAGVPGLGGGYVGVDVFFVISGFVITGVLLRERSATAKTSLVGFYGRRCRRIIPAATFVIVVSTLLAYGFLGNSGGSRTATDAKWAAVFLANFHFSATNTNYLASQQLPSVLQNFWSLAVEEQFYIVYPTLFLVVFAWRSRRPRGRALLAIVLATLVALFFAYSIVETAHHPSASYFSPLSRAWELGLGALVAVGTPTLRRLPRRVAAVATWGGLAMIAVAAAAFGTNTAYPGAIAAVPVAGAALVIAGGVRVPRWGAERLLGLSPFTWLGRLSYSVYLWHWPILTIAAERAGKASLPLSQSAPWVLVSVAAAAATYLLIENPVRHARFTVRYRFAGIALGTVLVALTLVMTVAVAPSTPARAAAAPKGPGFTTSSLDGLLAEAPSLRALPADLSPPLDLVAFTNPIPLRTGCFADYVAVRVPACGYGDPIGTHTMVLYGDSHAAMWYPALNAIAIRNKWRLVVLTKAACPVEMMAVPFPPGQGPAGTPWPACAAWQAYATGRILAIHPALLVVSQRYEIYFHYTSAQWAAGMKRFLEAVHLPADRIVDLQSTPENPGPSCLSAHTGDIRACNFHVGKGQQRIDGVERRAVRAFGADYVGTDQWMCRSTCTEVVGHYLVYYDTAHINVVYCTLLEGVLAEALRLPSRGLAS